MLPRWPKCRPWQRRSPISRWRWPIKIRRICSAPRILICKSWHRWVSRNCNARAWTSISRCCPRGDISKHLGGDVTTFARAKDGFLITQKGSLPVSVSTPALLLPVFAFGFVRSERAVMRPAQLRATPPTAEAIEDTRPEPVEEPKAQEEPKPRIKGIRPAPEAPEPPKAIEEPKLLRPGVKPVPAPKINSLQTNSKIQFAAFGNAEAKSTAKVTLVADSTEVKPAAARGRRFEGSFPSRGPRHQVP